MPRRGAHPSAGSSSGPGGPGGGAAPALGPDDVLQVRDKVEVYSESARSWLHGVVQDVYSSEGEDDDGYPVPAGAVKVASSAGVRYVLPGEMQTSIRRSETSRLVPLTPTACRALPGFDRPAARGRCGAARLKARDRWNTSEIKIQEFLTAVDGDGSHSMSEDQLRDLLTSDLARALNGGRPLSDKDIRFIMQYGNMPEAHRGGPARTTFADLNDALRAWHSLKNLDDSSLALFAEFDVEDGHGRCDNAELAALLIALNGGVQVPHEEVSAVAGALGPSSAVSRQELLSAVCAWHMRVDRAVTSLPTIWREALLRTATEHDQVRALKDGLRDAGAAASLVLGGGHAGYLEVNDSAAHPSPPNAESQEGPQLLNTIGGAPAQQHNLPQQWQQVNQRELALVSTRACRKLCVVTSPFLLGMVSAIVGWHTQDNACPRNLDGVLVWFGSLLMVLHCLLYVPPVLWAVQLRVAVAVLLTLLAVVGFSWSYDGSVDRNIDDCGRGLVEVSRLLWTVGPLGLAGYTVLVCSGHVKRLRDHDRRLQREINV